MLTCAENKASVKRENAIQERLKEQLKEYEEIEFYIKEEGQDLRELEERIENVEKSELNLKNQMHDCGGGGNKKQEKIDGNLETRLNVVSIFFLPKNFTSLF